jgi:hypothetical protein
MEERPILIKPNTTIAITVGTSSAAVLIPVGGGRQVLFCNRGSADVFYNFGASNVTVAIPTATAGGAVVPPGAMLTVTTPEGATHVATISGTASQTLYATAGDGA